MKQNTKKLPWSLISKYRAALMGVAMIAIYITHYRKSFVVNKVPIPWFIKNIGYGSCGVDMFLLLSGLGLCYSFAKNSSLSRFFRKRVVRILPAYLITEVLYFIILLIKDGRVDCRLFFEKMFFIRFFRKGDGAFWFVGAILICYLIFPLVYRAVKLTGNSLLNLIICIALYVVFHEFLWRFDYTLYKNTIPLVQRLHSFIFGVWIGRESLDNKEFPVFIIPLYWCATAVMMFRDYIPFFPRARVPLAGFAVSMFGVSVIFLCILLFEGLKNTTAMKQLLRFLSMMGGITLECYVMHSLFKWIFFSPYNPLLYLITCCILPTIAAWYLHKLCVKIIEKIG